MKKIYFAKSHIVAVLTALASIVATPTQAAGDLLVAPTRVVIDNSGTTQVILNNIGAEPATYRVSLEVKRMNANGMLDDVAESSFTAVDTATIGMISYSPRRITLPPNQPQIIRLAIRPDPALPDGEYRVHMLFRAIPSAKAATTQVQAVEGLSIALTPIYGVTIPIILRKGEVQSTTAIANPHLITSNGSNSFAFTMSRKGNGSVYGDVIVTKPGVAEPLLVARGIAAYPEVNERLVSIPIPSELATQLKGAVKVQLIQPATDGAGTLAEVQAVIR